MSSSSVSKTSWKLGLRTKSATTKTFPNITNKLQTNRKEQLIFEISHFDIMALEAKAEAMHEDCGNNTS
jgi:hypothetical protein